MGGRLPILVPAAVLALTLGLAACGGSSEDKQAVKKRVEGFQAALGANDPAKVCGALTKTRRGTLTRQARGAKNCGEAMRVAFVVQGGAFKNAGKAEVKDVRIDGENASASVTYGGRRADVTLSKEGGRWLISGFGRRGR
ncbi:MAG: hypothetical protein ABR581_08610 [Thermoleophilaceae bacterium]